MNAIQSLGEPAGKGGAVRGVKTGAALNECGNEEGWLMRLAPVEGFGYRQSSLLQHLEQLILVARDARIALAIPLAVRQQDQARWRLPTCYNIYCGGAPTERLNVLQGPARINAADASLDVLLAYAHDVVGAAIKSRSQSSGLIESRFIRERLMSRKRQKRRTRR